jgi:MFS family permease
LIGLACVAALGTDRLRLIFILSALPATAAALLLLCIREGRSTKSLSGRRTLLLSLAGTTRQFKLFLVAAGVFGLANSANAFLILRAQALGLDTGSTILAYTLYNAVAAVASFPAGAASDRLGRRNLLIAGYLVYAASYAGFAMADRAWAVWPLFALYGLFPALTDGVGKTLAIDAAGTAGHATAIGVYSMVIGLTQVAASYIGGVLWDRVDPSATFYFGAALATASAGLLLTFLPSRVKA